MNDVIMYATEISSIATKKLITATDPNSNGNVRKAVLLCLLLSTAAIYFTTL